jgi:hypothetical protein
MIEFIMKKITQLKNKMQKRKQHEIVRKTKLNYVAKLSASQKKQVDRSFEVTIHKYGEVIKKLGNT